MPSVAIIGWILALGFLILEDGIKLMNARAFGAIMSGAAGFSWMLSAATAISSQRRRQGEAPTLVRVLLTRLYARARDRTFIEELHDRSRVVLTP